MTVAPDDNNPLFGYTKVVKVDLNWLYRKYRGICWICRKFCPRDQASRDHIKPRSIGGGHEKDNIALAHKSCNTLRGNGYKEVYFKHYDSVDGLKDISILDEHGLLIQLWQDKRDGGYNLLVSKKKEEKPVRRRDLRRLGYGCVRVCLLLYCK